MTRLSSDMLHVIQEFGLILFVYTIGIQVGPGFFASLRVSGLRLNLFAVLIVIIGGLLHNRLFDKKLPVFLGIFQGTSYVVIIAFLVMIPCAWLTLLGWPKVQMGIESLQAFLRSAAQSFYS